MVFILVSLLIVPYGIETSSDWHKCAEIQALLIVPYGIETPCTLC